MIFYNGLRSVVTNCSNGISTIVYRSTLKYIGNAHNT
jgi:hypothetical protein